MLSCLLELRQVSFVSRFDPLALDVYCLNAAEMHANV
jgi:hypothetical protein